MLWQWSYSDYDVGFWGPPTVTINFCEEDYAVTYYCAEICNTLTNAMFVWLGLLGVRSCVRYKHPTIFLIAYLGYLIVGMGSISFHASLKYPMQLVDELSMIYTTCLMMFATFSYNRSTLFSFLMGVGLSGLAAFITAYYHITKNPVFHETCYAILTATVVFRGMWVMESQLRPAMKMRKNTENVQEKLRTMWLLVGLGLSVFLGGFFIWNLDNVFCSTIRQWRRSIGLPVAFLLEGHGWWHLMTGLAYYYIVWATWLRHCLAGNDDKYDLRWSRSITSIPEVVLIEASSKDKKLN